VDGDVPSLSAAITIRSTFRWIWVSGSVSSWSGFMSSQIVSYSFIPLALSMRTPNRGLVSYDISKRHQPRNWHTSSGLAHELTHDDRKRVPLTVWIRMGTVPVVWCRFFSPFRIASHAEALSASAYTPAKQRVRRKHSRATTSMQTHASKDDVALRRTFL
jgi:hypothetical protein